MAVVQPLLIEVFSAPVCSRCAGLMAMLKRVVEEFDSHVDLQQVNVLDEIDRAVQLGILMTPAIVIDGRLAFSVVPSEGKFRRFLARRTAL